MSQQSDHTQSARSGLAQPYVVEHYGFEIPSAAAADDPTPATAPLPPRGSASWLSRVVAGTRGKKLLAAAALGLVLTGGVGGYAVAMDDAGVDGRGDGNRRGTSLLEGRNGDIPRGGFGGPDAPRCLTRPSFFGDSPCLFLLLTASAS